MALITFLEDVPSEGIAKGATLEVDKFSAASLIERGIAKEYETPKLRHGKASAPVETIDDIVDPEVAINRRQMNATIVGGVDPAPEVTGDEDDDSEQAAPGPNPAGVSSDGPFGS